MWLIRMLVFGGAAWAALSGFHRPTQTEIEAIVNRQTMQVDEQADRIVLSWSGPIAAPMRDDLAAAIAHYDGDPRRFILALNSPGGSVAEGREVMAAIRSVKARRIDTAVGEGAVCASMCVPIYLLGAERIAGPNAHFMFHEIRLDAAKAGALREAASNLAVHKLLVNAFTDDLFANDIGRQRVNARWLAEMRKKIVGRDVWIGGRQLVDEGSGVVDRLAEGAGR